MKTSVKKQELDDSLSSILPAGNEAVNIELMDQMLKDANNDNIIDLDTSHNIVNENSFIRNKNKKGRYIDSSLNIFNDNNIIRNDTGSDISDASEASEHEGHGQLLRFPEKERSHHK